MTATGDTTSASATGDVTDTGGLFWPFATKDPKQYNRVDQGWDLQDTTNNGAGNPVFAAVDGKIETHNDSAGFGFYPVLLFTGNNIPAGVNATQRKMPIGIYYGHVKPVRADGEEVKAGQKIAETTNPSGGNASGLSGWLEIGYWFSNGPWPGNPDKAETPAGDQMKSDLSGGSPPSDTGNPPTGTDSASTGFNMTPSDVTAWQQSLPGVGFNFPDPRSNLPFHPQFLTNLWAGSNGPWTKGNSAPLVRGGMSELNERDGGRFMAFFMMNPQSINFSVDVDQSNQPMQDQTPDQQAGAAFIASSVSCQFSIYFNRMYEVWQGGFPGPSEVGVQWDIRAVERLMGLFDITAGDMAGTMGALNSSKWGIGVAGAQSTPIELVFGDQNSIAFQGRIMSMDYTYTMFDKNMVPVEAQMDIGVMKYYNPSVTADLIGAVLIGQADSFKLSAATGSFIGPSAKQTLSRLQ